MVEVAGVSWRVPTGRVVSVCFSVRVGCSSLLTRSWDVCVSGIVDRVLFLLSVRGATGSGAVCLSSSALRSRCQVIARALLLLVAGLVLSFLRLLIVVLSVQCWAGLGVFSGRARSCLLLRRVRSCLFLRRVLVRSRVLFRIIVRTLGVLVSVCVCLRLLTGLRERAVGYLPGRCLGRRCPSA